MTQLDTDPTPEAGSAPEMSEAELERLEADLATIEAAMDRVDTGDLDAAVTLMERLDGGSDEA